MLIKKLKFSNSKCCDKNFTQIKHTSTSGINKSIYTDLQNQFTPFCVKNTWINYIAENNFEKEYKNHVK